METIRKRSRKIKKVWSGKKIQKSEKYKLKMFVLETGENVNMMIEEVIYYKYYTLFG